MTVLTTLTSASLTTRATRSVASVCPQDIGGFDGDGIDAYGAPGNAMDTTGYGGVDAYFANNTIDALTVNFIGGIPGGGGQGYFSLEEPVSLSAPPVVTPGVPEASTWVMMAFGFAGLGLAGSRKAKAPKALSAA
ncbi:MAG: PEP-CTERM sorting domain-containing protein [Roseiarcus sp.]|uniref:PEP-CTERM sorting domain-containing protein n=1 Tax=Roseiarcus sp. TaxID=1969460 RepID=UPI003C5BA005